MPLQELLEVVKYLTTVLKIQPLKGFIVSSSGIKIGFESYCIVVIVILFIGKPVFNFNSGFFIFSVTDFAISSFPRAL